MTPMRKFGLKETTSKEELIEKIWDISSHNYDVQVKRKNSAARSMSEERARSRSAKSRLAEEEKEEEEAEKARKEEEEKRKKEEEEKKRKLRQKTEEYIVFLQVKVAKNLPEDLSVHVERVCEKQLVGVDSITEVAVPWNKLSTRVGSDYAE